MTNRTIPQIRADAEAKNKLLPCPFCGGEADTNELMTSPRRQYYLSCMTVGCEAEGPTRHSMEDAIAVWNKRAVDISALCDMVEAMDKALEEAENMFKEVLCDTPVTGPNGYGYAREKYKARIAAIIEGGE